MDYDIPGPVVIGVRCRVPPILVKHPVGEPQHLCKGIEPAVQEGEESQEENQHPWQDGVEDAEHHHPQVEELQVDAAELRDAEAHEDVVRVEQAAQHL